MAKVELTIYVVAVTHAWAKLGRATFDGLVPELLLPDHAADVAAVLRALLHGPVLRARVAALGGWADLPPAQEAAMLGAAFLHDIGKANTGFQRKRLPEGERRNLAGHVAEAAALLRLGYPPRAEVPLSGADAYLDPLTPAGAYLLAALGHHGRPLARRGLIDDARRARPFWRPDGDYDPVVAAEALSAALHRWLPHAATAMPDSDPPPALLHAFAGLVSLADWIASNDAPDFFPYPIEGDRWAFAAPRAAEVVAAMRLDLAPARAELATRAPGFAQVFGVDKPTPMQEAMADSSLGQVVLLEAATGSGKTEAALWRWQHLLREGEVDGLAFLLPTRTSAVQMEGRVCRAVAALWPDKAVRPNVVLAVPGYLRAEGAEGTRLPGFRVLWDDDPAGARAHARWAAESPRRGLAGAVVIGTVDQALMAALTTKHAHLRGACLLRHLLVVDEVHASDAYMTELLRTLLARQVRAGGHALLLSATLGAAARARLLAPDAAPAPQAEPPEQAAARCYPAISDASGPRFVPADPAAAKTVAVAREAWIDAPEAIAAAALAAAQAGARVLVLRNTVAGALAVQRAIEDAAPDPALLFAVGGVAAPHHGRFAAPDRRLLDAEVERRFGKQAARDERGCVLVGTQTLEMSLDIDADLMLTDLCPMDVLLQRLGRLHRHRDRVRPAGFEVARATVLVPEARDLLPFLARHGGSRTRHGLGRVYENVLSIEATWRQLAARAALTVPDDNRALVEAATHPETLRALAACLGEPWNAHLLHVTGVRAAERGQAGSAALRWDREPPSETAFPRDERLPTRLGGDDRRFRLEPAAVSPFGQGLEEIVVPGWMARDVPVECEVMAVEEKLIFVAKGSAVRYVYGRSGLERLDG